MIVCGDGFGGSRGAEKINQTMIDVLKHFAGRTDIHLLHITEKNIMKNSCVHTKDWFERR